MMVYTLYPKSSLAIYGEGDYSFELEGYEKNISKAIYNLSLNGREKNLYFNSSLNLQIDLKDKKPKITNNNLSIYNKLYNLALFNISFGIGQLVEPALNLYGAKFETLKKSDTKTNKAMFFVGKSANAQLIGTKINIDYGSNTSYALFLLKKENNQIVGLNFSRPIYKFSLLEGECYLNNENKWGLLLKDSINRKYTTLGTEYSIINNISMFKLFSMYNTKKLNTEFEYSTTNHNTLWRLKTDFNKNNFRVGAGISEGKSRGNAASFAKQTFSYNGYARYNWRFSEKIAPFILYSHSYYNNISALSMKNIRDDISFGISYFDLKSKLSISPTIGVEMANQQTINSIKKELTFKKRLGIRYEYYGFRPWAEFNFRTTEDKIDPLYQKESSSISYGMSKDITRNLSLSYNCYQTEDITESLSKKRINRINKYLTLDYRFPKIPVVLNTRFSLINKEKPTSFISITYKKKDKKDTFVKYQDEEIKYARERAIKLGTLTGNICSISKEFPTQEKLLSLGRIIIMVFKDKDFDGKFAQGDIPIKGIKATLDKAEVVTNEYGKASFIEIPAGTYTFSIEFSGIPLGLACTTKVEPIIRIKPGEDIYLNFPFVTPGEISGGVFIDENRNGIWDEKEKGVEGVLIYANDIPKYTSFTGKYKIKNVIPGKVNVKIEVNSIPENFELTTKECIEIKLLPKQEIKNINFGIAEIEPEIEFEEGNR